MKILAVGTVAFDAIETPFGKTDKILGGAATYIGLAASVMKTDVSLVSVIGGDFPQHYLDMMTSKGINIDGVEMIKDGKTFFWSGKYHNDLNSRDTLATTECSRKFRSENSRICKRCRSFTFRKSASCCTISCVR